MNGWWQREKLTTLNGILLAFYFVFKTNNNKTCICYMRKKNCKFDSSSVDI